MNSRMWGWACVGIVTALLGACSTTTTRPAVTIANTAFGAASAPAAPEPGTTVIQQATVLFANDLYASATASDPSDANTKALRAFRSGRAMLDLRCSEYLDALGIANQAASNERQQVGIVGGFTSAIMGLAGSPAKAVAGVATTFSFAGASMDAFTTTFLFSDASKSITKLVRDAQRAYLLAIQDQLEGLDYAGMVTLLTGYEQTCRPSEIRRLVDEAVAASTIVAETPGAESANAQVTILLGNLTGALGRLVTEGDGIVLYAWFSSVADRQAIKDQSAFIKALNLSDDELAAKLSPQLLPLSLAGNPVAKRWADAVTRVAGTQTATAVKTAAQAKAVADTKVAEAAMASALAAKPPEEAKTGLLKKAEAVVKTASEEKVALEKMKPADAKAAVVAKAPAAEQKALLAMTPQAAKAEALSNATKAAQAAANERDHVSKLTPDAAKAEAVIQADTLARAAEAAQAAASAAAAVPAKARSQLTVITPIVRAR